MASELRTHRLLCKLVTLNKITCEPVRFDSTMCCSLCEAVGGSMSQCPSLNSKKRAVQNEIVEEKDLLPGK